jgi:hypothetical protein
VLDVLITNTCWYFFWPSSVRTTRGSCTFSYHVSSATCYFYVISRIIVELEGCKTSVCWITRERTTCFAWNKTNIITFSCTYIDVYHIRGFSNNLLYSLILKPKTFFSLPSNVFLSSLRVNLTLIEHRRKNKQTVNNNMFWEFCCKVSYHNMLNSNILIPLFFS